MLISRIFTVLTAALLLAAFALYILAPEDMTLGAGLETLGVDLAGGLQNEVVSTAGHRVWAWIFVPLLVRPVWLVPLSLGAIAAGVAVTTAAPPGSRSSTRRRS